MENYLLHMNYIFNIHKRWHEAIEREEEIFAPIQDIVLHAKAKATVLDFGLTMNLHKHQIDESFLYYSNNT